MPTQTKLQYTIKRYRRAKNVRIHIDARARVTVTAPVRCSKKFIHQFVEDQQEWIASHKQKIAARSEKWVMPEGVLQDSYAACHARARRFVRERLRHYNAYYNFDFNKVSVRDMKTRWGSCSSEGNLSFHYRLLFVPVELADYVIVHELCHLQELNHSARFWRRVSEQIPDYKKRKALLNRYPI